jgi:LCP family protein required for cell wall assembly
MSDTRDVLARVLARVPAASDDSWTRARAAWDGSAPALGVIETTAVRRHARALTLRAALALGVSVVVVVAAISLVRARMHSVQPHVASGLELDAAAGANETFLVVGVDRRTGLAGVRADTIALLRFDAATTEVSMLSVPRDLFVTTARGRVRLAQVYAGSGREGLVAAIRDTLHIDVQHYVELDFAGFARAVDDVGGVRLAFPTAQRDLYSGLGVQAGCQVLNGTDALAFVRSRHVQIERDGVWRPDASAELGRIRRGQIFLDALAQRALARVRLDPAPELRRLLDQVTADPGLDVDDLLRLVRAVEGDSVRLQVGTLPVARASVGGQDVVVATDASAAAVSDFQRGAPFPPGGERAPDPLALPTPC